MSATGKVDALWVGIYGAQLPDGTLLETGITVYSIGRDEARDSDNWEPLTKAEAKAADKAADKAAEKESN